MSDSPLLLLVLLAALAAVPLILRRYRRSTPDAIRVVGRTALHKGAVVAVVAVGERRLLVGAGDRGVQLLAELGPTTPHVAAEPLDTTTTSTSTSTGMSTPIDQRDGDVPTSRHRDALDALTTSATMAGAPGPGIGLLDRLRAMTVRTPVQGRPFHVPLRR